MAPNTRSETAEAEISQLALEEARFKRDQAKAAADLSALTLEKVRQEMAQSQQESATRIAALTNPQPAAKDTTGTTEENTGEIPLPVLQVSDQFAGLPQAELVKIYFNTFKPINLLKLRYLRGLGDHQDEDDDKVSFQGNVLRIKKVTCTYKDYGKTPDIWSESFLNYAQILLAFHGQAVPKLAYALSEYHRDIMDLARTYNWQEAVLLLAIDYHTYITESAPSDPTKWEIPARRIARVCTHATIQSGSTSRSRLISSSDSKRRRSASPLRSNADPNDASVKCRNFNSKGCTSRFCKREHKCNICGLSDHGGKDCKM